MMKLRALGAVVLGVASAISAALGILGLVMWAFDGSVDSRASTLELLTGLGAVAVATCLRAASRALHQPDPAQRVEGLYPAWWHL